MGGGGETRPVSGCEQIQRARGGTRRKCRTIDGGTTCLAQSSRAIFKAFFALAVPKQGWDRCTDVAPVSDRRSAHGPTEHARTFASRGRAKSDPMEDAEILGN